MVDKRYRSALALFQEKDRYVRQLMGRILRAVKTDRYYLLSPEDIAKVNEAQVAWQDFLRAARR